MQHSLKANEANVMKLIKYVVSVFISFEFIFALERVLDLRSAVSLFFVHLLQMLLFSLQFSGLLLLKCCTTYIKACVL